MVTTAFNSTKIRKTAADIAAVLSGNDLAKVLQAAVDDKALLAKAKASPEALLKKHGIKLPPQSEVRMTVKKFALRSAIGTRVPRFTFELCVIVTFVIGRGTPWEQELHLKFCRTYVIF